MTRLAFLGVLAAIPLSAAVTHPDLAHVRKVYVLSMGSGFDQYIANHLTASGIFEITTDPLAADTILTDSVGESFERRYKELYIDPVEKAKEAEAAAKAKDDKNSAASQMSKSVSADSPPRDRDETIYSFQDQRPISTFSRGRGNIFLVDRASRKVVWSTYERPRSHAADELDHTASRIAKELQKATKNAVAPSTK